MRIDILTIFPRFFDSPFSQALLGKAAAAGRVRLAAIDIRDFADDKHLTTDDYPFGGGEGMLMKPEPIARAIENARVKNPGAPVYLLSPQGRRFDQDAAEQMAHLKGLILICGRYEGVDARIAPPLIDGELSVGDYVLAGGETAALAVVEAVTRLVPGVVGNEGSVVNDSFPHRLKYPQYTRPREFRGMTVPDVLLSGDHDAIDAWRRRMSLIKTKDRRPDLLAQFPPDDEERAILASLDEDEDD